MQGEMLAKMVHQDGPYSQFEDVLGIDKLVSYLAKLFMGHVHDHVPKLLTELEAARQAVSVCCNSAPSRERELMLAVADDELCRTMIGNVKVVATGQQIAQATRSLKAEKKAVATARAKGKGNDE